ncbi:glutamyl-tRNA(Gln) amidotransferase subunit E [Archaeoglobus sulfaticallidus PM70-1]|uniref:Glutamyl-tRNA(Gln) amidotransferase subunit E n=1 Tax=Archaeoglobus sulfaticallidus PM70-1 TaxID=387631 RepID=N0BA60_9EURY|nr:Glu-tRNA(Gln) amidotransferase subunit GatE [Archaeoglobus sulfaticallidus]AGK60474.1 glutamyl-tRNA(Gln) amidotransferase subunit E [Archaeoglobus sulfaticallidus PM70-1]
MSIDYDKLGLKVGIEIHQQLDTERKLFCNCPTFHRDVEDSNFEFFRYLRAKKSEMGEEDRAAKEEVLRSKKFIYKFYDTTCLVEADEEPPTEINREALKIAIQVAKMLNMDVVDEIHVMRKIVIDGSNTTGFQRTALVALNGHLDIGDKRIGVSTLCVEEEACRKVEEGEGYVVYSLDRLGIPLIEIGTDPDITNPDEAMETARKLGMILRSTGKVKRGLGTIRQDVNISIKDGARVEIKGVQELDILAKIVEYEVIRQINLLKIRDELKSRNAEVVHEVYDVREVFKDTKSKILRKAGFIGAIVLRKFAGIVGREIQPNRRLGTEFSDIAKTFGLGGIFHTDELPAYGISKEEVEKLREYLNAGEEDAVILAGGSRDRVIKALERICERAEACLHGIPEETRKANEDGTTSYLRPLPGSARMYPETDVSSVVVDEELLDVEIPELIEERARRYREMGLSEDLASIIADSPYYDVFEEYSKHLAPALVARVLHLTPSELKKDGFDVSRLERMHFVVTLDLLKDGKIAKEGVYEVLKIFCSNPSASEEEIIEMVGGTEDLEKDLESFISSLITEKSDFIRERGINAFKPLMGLVMKEFRGKIDGKVIADKLKAKIEEFLGG